MREVFILLTLLLFTGCAVPRGPEQAQAAEVAPAPVAEHVEGDVHQPTITEMEESARESGVETGGGEVRGDVTTTRYGLDEQMAGLLEQYGERTVGVLGKVIGSAIVAVAGLLLWALNTNAPSSETLKLVGQVVGLAAMVAGPVLVWTML
jgi:hypothetical protein